MDISETIKGFRKREGLTQKKLADLTGLSIATIQGYEQGKYRPKIEALQKIAIALQVHVSTLLAGTDIDYNEISKIRDSDAKNMML